MRVELSPPSDAFYPDLTTVDLVTGKNDHPFCNMERDPFYTSTQCKEEGLLWEQKPWWEII